MSPSSTVNDVVNGGFAHRKVYRKLKLCCVAALIQVTHFLNLIFGKCGVCISNAYGFTKPSFFGCITRVITERTKKQMAWVAAFWIVAFVADTKTFSSCSETKFKGETMGAPVLSFYGKHAITFCCEASLPVPAFVRPSNIYLFPKSACTTDWVIGVRFVNSTCNFDTLGSGHAKTVDRHQNVGTKKIT